MSDLNKMVRKEVKHLKISKDGALKKGNDKETCSPGVSKGVRSSNRLKGKANAVDQKIDKDKGKRKQAPEDTNIEKAKSPQKRINTQKGTPSKKKAENKKKSNRDDSAQILRSSNRLKGKASADEKGKKKRKQAPEDTNMEKFKSQQKKRGVDEETQTNKKVEYPKKSKGVVSKKGNDDEEKTGFAGPSKVLRSSNRLKGKKRDLEDGNAEAVKSFPKRTKTKVEKLKKSAEVALRKVGRGKSIRDDSGESDKERIYSAGTSKGSRSFNRLTTKAKADKIIVDIDKTEDKDLFLKKSSRGNFKRGKNGENDEENDSAGTVSILRASKRARGKANADENNNNRRRKLAPEDRKLENAESSQKKRKANEDEIERKKRVPKKKVTHLGKNKDGKAKVEKRKMPHRMCRSNSKTR